MSDTVTSVENYGTEELINQAEVDSLLIGGGPDRYEVEWDAQAKVTPMGSLVFFAQYLRTGGLITRLCRETPLAYSTNAPETWDTKGKVLDPVVRKKEARQ